MYTDDISMASWTSLPDHPTAADSTNNELKLHNKSHSTVYAVAG